MANEARRPACGSCPAGFQCESLLESMMRNGERVEGRLKTLDEARERAGRAREPLPPKGTASETGEQFSNAGCNSQPHDWRNTMSEQIRETATNADAKKLESMMTAAVDIYREAMRQFIVRVLSDVPGLTPTEAVEQALTGENLISFHRALGRGGPLDEALDVGYFSFIYREWKDRFRKYVADDEGLTDRMWLVREIRNRALHKNWSEFTPGVVTARIVDIVEVLERIGEQDGADEVRTHLGPVAVLLVADERRQAAEPDRDALLALYQATGGDEWLQDDHWLSDRPVGEWWGVTTNAEGRVEVLDLRHNQLSGELPHALGNLTELSELCLSGNQLSGTIPPQLGDLAQLTDLDLSGNQLSGSIPSDLRSLTQLTNLDLSANQLSKSIPRTLRHLTQLTKLDLSGNQLEGDVPAWLGDLPHLSVLNLSDNQLTGGIPSWLGDIEELTLLNLGDNPLGGKIPAQLGDLKALTVLNLSNSQLSGGIPSWLGDLKALTYLNLGSNQLTGEIPSRLGDLKELTHLYLSNNQLSGGIPSWLGALRELTVLNLSNNQLTGEIPAQLGDLKKSAQLDLSNNQLSGEIPSWLGRVE